MEKERLTLGEFLRFKRLAGEDVDISVDGIDTICYCGAKLTPAAEEKFKKALAMPMLGHTVISDNDEDYDTIYIDEADGPCFNEDNPLVLAWLLLSGAAGYMPSEEFDEYFIID